MDTFILVLDGKYTTHKRPMEMLLAAIELTDVKPKAKILLLGSGPLTSELNEFTRQKCLQNIAFKVGFVNQSEIPTYFRLVDVLFVPSSIVPDL